MKSSRPLYSKDCRKNKPGDKPFDSIQVAAFLPLISNSWQLIDNKLLYRRINLPEFSIPMELANKIAKIADKQWHHPSLKISWGILEIEIFTHNIGGLVESDFIFAAKVDHLVDSESRYSGTSS